MSTNTARTVTRRRFVAGTVGLGVAMPSLIRGSLASSGELTWFTWDDYTPKGFLDRFTADTGIKINVTAFTGNEDALNKLRASRGQGFDLATPGLAWVQAGIEHDLYQPININKISNLGQIDDKILSGARAAGGDFKGELYGVPLAWSTEAIAGVDIGEGETSYAELWKPEYNDRVTCRARTLLLTIGLLMERQGTLQPGTMRRCYSDQELMTQTYSKTLDFAIERKGQIRQFWLRGGEQKAAFLQNGATIGLVWDSVAYSLQRAGEKIKYRAPVEGALTVIDSNVVLKGCKNEEQAYAFINWTLQPEIGALMTNNIGYNSVVKGAETFYSEDYRKFFAGAYSGDDLDRLFIQGTERSWFIAERQRFVDRLLAA